MMPRRSKAQIESMNHRAEQIGLHPTMNAPCTTEEEQDIMLQLQNKLNIEFSLEYITTVPQENNYGDKPLDDRQVAIECLRKLKAYAKNYEDYNLQEALSDIKAEDIIIPPKKQKAKIAHKAIKLIDETVKKRSLRVAAKEYFKDIPELEK